MRGEQTEEHNTTEVNQYKPKFKDVLLGLRSTPGGETLSVSQLIQMKLKQITSGNIDTVELDGSTHNLDVPSSKDLGVSNVSSGGLGWIEFCYSTCTD